MKLATILLLVAACSAQEPTTESPTAPTLFTGRLDHCATLGFDADALDCQLCDDLSTFLGPRASKKNLKQMSVDKLTKECQECCSDFSKVLEAEGRRYSKVALAVDRRRLKRYPKVANFVEHQAEQIKRLEVQETNPRLPMLQFFDDEGEKIEEISVAHWDENSIAEFIEKKLLPAEKIVEMEVEADKP